MTTPSKRSGWRIWRDVVFTIVSPRRVADEKAGVVCRAFWESLGLVLFFSAIGYAAGKIFVHFYDHMSPSVIGGLQVGGAMLLLWGTLFVRGWEIQTFSNQTSSEQVNQRIYRSLYCIGTSLIVFSLVV